MSIRVIVSGRPLSSSAVSGVEVSWDQAGSATRDTASHADDTRSPTNLLETVQVLAAFDLSAASRSSADAAEQPRELDLREDDIIEWELEGGFKTWTSVAAYHDELKRDRPELIQEGAIHWAPPRRLSAEHRGVAEWKNRAVRFLRLGVDKVVSLAKSPEDWPRELKVAVKERLDKLGIRLGAWATVKALAWLIERQLTPGPGLYPWPNGPGGLSERFQQAIRIDRLEDCADKPILICLHGTASSTVGSFGYLESLNPKHGGDRQREWRAITDFFGPHIYAWEHRTLGESPIENALALAKILPERARLSLLSHSRGGLVGELLCLPEIPQQWCDRYSHGSGMDDADGYDKAQLAELDATLRDKKFHIERFARVACPARGTLLASENIERFLSLLLHLIGLIPGLSTSATYQVLQRIVLEVARNRTNAKWIPGIAAMVPDSPLVRMLNAAREQAMNSEDANALHAKGHLGVIAGDWGSQDAGILPRLLVPISDLFVFGGEDNDWVVNTESMFLGAPRKGESYYVFDQGGDVSHFNYFANSRTRAAVANWLAMPTTSGPVAGVATQAPSPFERIAMETPSTRSQRASTDVETQAARARLGAPDSKKPLLFFLPDLFGSNLAIQTDETSPRNIWLDFDSLSRGGLEELSLARNPNNLAPTISPFYNDWSVRLGDHYEVMGCAYDWRQSIDDSVQRVRETILSTLRGEGRDDEQPASRGVRFVGHGMGAMLLRKLFSQEAPNKELIDNLKTVAGDQVVRALMLGAPHRGMPVIASMLTGFDSSLRRLALLDPGFPLSKALDLFASFPGVLELLPDERRWFSQDTWKSLRESNRGVGAIPTQAALDLAQAAIAKRGAATFCSSAWMKPFSVAGVASGTVSGVTVDRNHLDVLYTDLGDGRVPHDYTILSGVETYYADADHGELAWHIELIPAYVELLESGFTTRLARTPISTAGISPTPTRSPKAVLFPTGGELIDDLLGKTVTRPRRVKSRQVAVSVLHGDLRYAKYPVMVGHYEGDTIGGSERYLDRKLRGQLMQHYQFGNYPGALGKSLTIVPHRDRHVKQLHLPVGALVVGLGRMGELSSSDLTQAIRDGLVDYALEMSSRHDFEDAAEPRSTIEQLGVSLLIIGSQTTPTMTIEDCVSAMLRGVAMANRDLARSRCRSRLGSVEIVELFLDSAIAALNAAVNVAPSLLREFETELIFPSRPARLTQHRSGQLRINPLSTSHTWRRWEVTALPSPASQETVRNLPRPLYELLRDTVSKTPLDDPATRDALFQMAFPPSQVDAAVPLGLRFVAMADRARAEKTVEGRQRPVIDDLIRRSIDAGFYDPDIARTLGQLLIPNDLKDSIAQLDRLVLVLDGETAKIPWELLVLDDAPLATRIGLVRQLITTVERSANRMAVRHDAYVVGNPITGGDLPSLVGAQREAEEVAALLSNHGFAVEDRYTQRAEAHQVFVGLMRRPYRVLHLAGHGYFARDNAAWPARYGMLLNGDQFLTAEEIRQLPQTPELVFLNCCHLAGVDGETRRERQFEYSKLASSLAEELIQMGVRAIVAAGWAVRDDLAKMFAEEFYKLMLAGEPFGDAVKEARRAVWGAARESNTWAAYQAYGDPDYRLRARATGDGGSRAVVASGAARLAGGVRRRVSVSPAELSTPQQLLERLRQIAITGRIDEEESLRRLNNAVESPDAKLDALVGTCPREWRERIDVLGAFGRAYSELGRFSEAIDFLRRACAAASTEDDTNVDGDLTFKTVELLANCETRQGVATKNAALIESALARLDILCQLGKTPERLALRGAAWKAQATFDANPEGKDQGTATATAKEIAKDAAKGKDAAKDKERERKGKKTRLKRVRAALMQSCADYTEAANLEQINALKANRRRNDYYLSNAVAIRLILGQAPSVIESYWPDYKSTPQPATGNAAAAAAISLTADNYWDAIAEVDRALYRALEASRDPAAPPTARSATPFAEKLAALYIECWEYFDAAPRAIDSSIRQFEFIAAMFELLNPKDPRVAELRRLRGILSDAGH